MSLIPDRFKFTKDHEWFHEETGKLGITDHAQKNLGDVVFIELPEPQSQFSKGEAIATIESVKAVAEVYAPSNGTVTNINQILKDDPGVLNRSPYEDGWIIEWKPESASTSDFLNHDEYLAFLETL